MEERHSDELFRDKLTDFSSEPDPQVWQRIERSLDQRKSRRVLPIWWRLGGVAALLALALYVFLPQEEDREPQGVPVPMDGPAVTGSPVKTQPSTGTEKSRTYGVENESPESNPKSTEIAGSEGEADFREHSASGGQSESTATGSSAAVAKPDPGIAGHLPATPTEDKATDNLTAQNGIREAGSGTPVLQAKARIQDPSGNPPAEQSATGGSGSSPALLADRTERSGDAKIEKDPEADGQSIFDAIAEQEALTAESSTSSRWAVGPSLAPVYFNSFGDGSPISENFVANSKSGTVNMSYGLAVSYNLSKKWSLRSGVHRVDFGYNTNQVSFTSRLGAAPSSLIQTISYSENSKNVVVHSNAGGPPPGPGETVATDVSAPSPERQGSMVQEFGYLEVPLEVQYALLEQKFGLSVIGGMSSLFLVDNQVSLNSSGSRTAIGEARNINSVNFSGNLGLGLYYSLNPSLQLNMMPMFKYHLNTFSETAGAFRPYSVGVYSGLSFKF